MKRMLLGMMTMMMLVVSGCGDTSVAVVIPLEPVINPPSITLNLPFTQDTTNEIVFGSVSFYAPDSYISSMSVDVFNSVGTRVYTSTTYPPNLSGRLSGTILFSIDYFPFLNDNYSFSIYLTDLRGYVSNSVAGRFPVP